MKIHTARALAYPPTRLPAYRILLCPDPAKASF
jgi:hypothetical protein